MFSNIEQDTRQFLKRIVKTIFFGLFWMFAQVILGIFLQGGFIDKKPTIWNILFYLEFVVTFFFLARFYIKIWKHILQKKEL
jgi:hypothetical protein